MQEKWACFRMWASLSVMGWQDLRQVAIMLRLVGVWKVNERRTDTLGGIFPSNWFVLDLLLKATCSFKDLDVKHLGSRLELHWLSELLTHIPPSIDNSYSRLHGIKMRTCALKIHAAAGAQVVDLSAYCLFLRVSVWINKTKHFQTHTVYYKSN